MGLIDNSLVLLHLGLSDSSTDVEKALVQSAITMAEQDIRRYLGYDPVQKVWTEYYPQMSPALISSDVIWEANSTTAYARRVSGPTGDELQLRHLPVRATDANGANAISVRIDYDGRSGSKSGAFAADTAKTEGQDFWPNYDGVDDNGILLSRDGILRSVGLWPDEPGSVRVTYVAGYTEAELAGHSNTVDAHPLQVAALDEASRRVKKALLTMKSDGTGWTAGPMSFERLGDYSYSIGANTITRLFSGVYGLMPETRERLAGFVNYARAM